MTESMWVELNPEYQFNHIGWLPEDDSGVLIIRGKRGIARFCPVSRSLYQLCVDYASVPDRFIQSLGAATAHIAEEPSDTPVAEFQKQTDFSPTERSCYWALFASLCSQYSPDRIRLATGHGSLSARAAISKHRERSVCALALTLEQSRDEDFSTALTRAYAVFPTLSEDIDIFARLDRDKCLLDEIALRCLDTRAVLKRDVSACSRY